MSKFIEQDKYVDILQNVVNLCVDVCLRYNHSYVFVKRKEEPCKGVYWPVGGRVLKGEKMEDAARRKIKEELGLEYTGNLNPIGYYEDTYSEHSLGTFPYSSLSVVWLGYINKTQWKNITLDHTSEEVSLVLHLPDRFKVRTFHDFGRPYWYVNSGGWV